MTSAKPAFSFALSHCSMQFNIRYITKNGLVNIFLHHTDALKMRLKNRLVMVKRFMIT